MHHFTGGQMAIHDSRSPTDPQPTEPAGKFYARSRGRWLAMVIGISLAFLVVIVFFMKATGYNY
jgi:hypothetical protein